jgi:hypothetical protein
MTYRIYVRWPKQKVSHKTTTDSKKVADAAWDELKNTQWEGENKPIGLTYSHNGTQVDYVDLSDSAGNL